MKFIKKRLGKFLMLGICAFGMACNDEKDPPIPESIDGDLSKIFLAGTAGDLLPVKQMEQEAPLVFSYTGVLSAGDLYFTAGSGDGAPVYKKGETETTVQRDGSAPFHIPQKGYYRLMLNLEDNTFSIDGSPLDDVLYMVGPPVDTWSGGQSAYVANSGENPFVYTYTHFFFAGAYKFLLQKDNLLAKFVPDGDKESIRYFATEDELVGAGYGDANWNLAASGDYTFRVNLLTSTVSADPATYFPEKVDSVFIIGNKYGWDALKGGQPLLRDSQNTLQFSIQDNMDAGEFKFILQRHNFRPALVKNTDTQFSYLTAPTDEQDIKWNIPEPGNYTVSLDLGTNAITIQKN